MKTLIRIRILLFLPILLLLFVLPGCSADIAIDDELVLTRSDQVTATEARQLLEEGNQRFVAEKPALKEAGEARRNQLVRGGQKPFAVILSCSDSRVPPEVVFDWALGDLFVIRTAGNVIDPIALGSIEYAVENLNVPLIVVLGHDSCGAVKATIEAMNTSARVSPNIGAIIEKIQPSVIKAEGNDDNLSPLAELAEDENIRLMAEEMIDRSSAIAKLVETGDVTILGAKYYLRSGEVIFFD